MPTGILNVDPSLPIDPLSLTFSDSQGRSFHPPTLGFSFGVEQNLTFLKVGETYEVGVDSCSDELNQNVKLYMGDLLAASLRDDDGDGRYTGSFTYNPSATAAESDATAADSMLRFSVINGGAAQSFELTTDTLAPGIVRDLFSQQPLANAAVTALGASNSPWPNAALGQPNPQMTGADGSYSFLAPGGVNRLDVLRAGYQPYRSWDISGSNGWLVQDLALTPALPDTAVHTIYVTNNGFNPAILTAQPGSIIEWVNADLGEHSVNGAVGDSGVLDSGQSYRTRLDTPGTYNYSDKVNPLSEVTIIVAGGQSLFLPLVTR